MSGPSQLDCWDSTLKPVQQSPGQVDTVTEVTVTTRQEEAAAITKKWKSFYWPSRAEVERAAELAAAGVLTSDISCMELHNADLSGVPTPSLARLLSLCTY